MRILRKKFNSEKKILRLKVFGKNLNCEKKKLEFNFKKKEAEF